MGAKGCVIFAGEPLREYRDYLTKVDGELSTLAWLYHMNHGIFMTPGVEEEWTLSIAHSDDDIDHYVAAFEAFARDVDVELSAARLGERRPGALEVVGRDHELDPAEGRVGELDVDVGLAQRPSQLAERPGPILDVDDQHLALVG